MPIGIEELVYIMAGGGSQIINGREYQVSHGSLLFIDYGQTHSWITRQSMTFVHILLEPEFFSRELVNVESIIDIFCYNMFSEFSGKHENAVQCVTFPKEELAKVDNLIDVMVQEYEQKNLGYLSVLPVIQTARCFTSTLRRYTGSLPEVSGGKSRNSLKKSVISPQLQNACYPIYLIYKVIGGMSYEDNFKRRIS